MYPSLFYKSSSSFSNNSNSNSRMVNINNNIEDSLTDVESKIILAASHKFLNLKWLKVVVWNLNRAISILILLIPNLA